LSIWLFDVNLCIWQLDVKQPNSGYSLLNYLAPRLVNPIVDKPDRFTDNCMPPELHAAGVVKHTAKWKGRIFDL
jgi:hypothetical protein